MITLLAESKTMSPLQEKIEADILKAHTPVLEINADEIMAHMASLSPAELAQILGISNQLAIKAFNLAYDFPHKASGYSAIKGFTGEAFKGLDFFSLPEETQKQASDKLRIISSVYGILNPFDIIKPYRCEFNKPIGIRNQTPIKIFKPKVTIEFVKYIKENKIPEIICLLPGDADKCLDWKIIRAFSSVHKICFQEINHEGKLKTPIAGRLKELRGKMCREILSNNIQTFEELTKIQSEDFIYSPHDSKPGLPVFISS